MELGGGEILAGRERAENRKPHCAVGERGQRTAVNHIVRVVQIDTRRHFECRAAVGHGDEAHIEEADVRRWWGGAT